jgi:hypothetical protein
MTPQDWAAWALTGEVCTFADHHPLKPLADRIAQAVREAVAEATAARAVKR